MIILESEAVNPSEAGVTQVPDMVVQAIEVNAQIRLERLDGSLVSLADNTEWNEAGDLKSLSESDPRGRQSDALAARGGRRLLGRSRG